VAAGEKISLFVQKAGFKAFAAKGPVEVQAQGGPMSLDADQELTIASVNGVARIVAKTELTLESGGAFIQMKDGSITLGGPNDLFLKVITIQKQGKATLNQPLDLTHPALSGPPTVPLTFSTGASPASRAAIPVNMPYSLFVGKTLVKQGVFDETGLLQVDHHPTTQKYTLTLANGASYTLPVAEQYHGKADNGGLANIGFQFHENGKDPDISPIDDRATHRQDYSGLLDDERSSESGE
ncbi:DUF2345 domain-containing protein, partial [Paraburkholderia oxyphila]|uniref:DUF2345 domain-containing protein n=1 Tax=Paraburkholderia oxyphila TaxID=614212 RepID=UPI0005BCFD0B